MRNIAIIPPDDVDSCLLIGCIGFETRSTAALKHHSERGAGEFRAIMFDYSTPEVSYGANRRLALELNCELHCEFNEFIEAVKSAFTVTCGRITVDVTSFDREKIAAILQVFFATGNTRSSLSMVYYPQTFREPGRYLEEVTSFGPVTPAFIGISNPDKPNVNLIVGAGFEYGRAVSAIDLLEPSETHCYVPIGADNRFEERIKENNLDFSFLGREDQLIPYYISEPNSLFFDLMSTISAFSGSIIILPLGPKIFAAVSIVAALCHHPEVMVWRHSVKPRIDPVKRDAVPSGQRITFTVSLL